jgi:hypothetical protein
MLSSLQQLLYRGNGSYGSVLKGSFPAVRAQTCPSANGPKLSVSNTPDRPLRADLLKAAITATTRASLAT